MPRLSRRLTTTLALATMVALAGSGCGNDSTNNTPDIAATHSSSGLAQPPTNGPPSSTDVGSTRTPRNTIAKKLGEPAGICVDRDCTTVAVTFTVDKITPDVACAAPYSDQITPQNGHFIAVEMTIKTTEQFSETRGPSVSFSPYGFAIIGPDGVTESALGGGYGCLPSNQELPSTLAPASQYHGTVLLDARNTKGILALRMPGSAGGWEWVI